MFGSKSRGTLIAKGLKIVGTVTAEGLVEVDGRVDGEIHCTSLLVARGAHVAGTVVADRVVVDGTVEGPIQGADVVLKSKAHVIGDIRHQSLSIQRGAIFDGRSVHGTTEGETTDADRADKPNIRQIGAGKREAAPALEEVPPAPRRKLAEI